MQKSKSGVYKTVSFLSVVVALMAGLYVAQHLHTSKKPDDFHGTLLDNPRVVTQFALTGTDHQPYTNASLQGHWTMMFFGFTHCGYMCPTTMAELGKMYRLLEEKNATTLPQVVMISLDPKRDDLSRLGQYVQAFDRHFYGARGDQQMIQHLSHDLGIAYTKVTRSADSSQSPEDDIEHTGAIMLFNPHGDLVAFFTNPHQAAGLADDFLLLTQGNRYS